MLLRAGLLRRGERRGRYPQDRRQRLALSRRRDPRAPVSAPLAVRARSALRCEEEAQQEEEPQACATRQSAARVARLSDDAEDLLHPGLRPLRRRTLLLSLALLASARGHGQHGQHPASRRLLHARTRRAADRAELLPRRQQLRRFRWHLHEHAARLRRHGRATRGARRGQVLRRQRLDRHRARAALQAQPQPRPAR